MARPPLPATLAAIAVAGALLVGCSSGQSLVSATATTAAPATTTSAPATRTTLPASHPLGNGDWDGARWDAGNVVGMRAAHGAYVITFDRYQIYDAHQVLREGKQLTSQPVEYGDTRYPYVNSDPTLRTYVVTPDAVINEISNTQEICQDLRLKPPLHPAPAFSRVDPAALVAASAKGDVAAPGLPATGEDALTFNATGQVVDIVFSTGCESGH